MTKAKSGGSVEAVVGGPLRIALSCPKCGGPFEVDDEATGFSCEHCGSLLVLEAPERDEIYVGEILNWRVQKLTLHPNNQGVTKTSSR